MVNRLCRQDSANFRNKLQKTMYRKYHFLKMTVYCIEVLFNTQVFGQFFAKPFQRLEAWLPRAEY